MEIKLLFSLVVGLQMEKVVDLKKNGKIPFKLMLGHSGWSSGQLEREIENGDWLIQNATSDFVFNVPPKQMWKHAAISLGVDLGSSFGVSGQA